MLISQDPEERMKGVEELGDNVEALMYAALKSGFEDVAIAVVAKLKPTDVKALTALALDSVFKDVSKAAIAKLADTAVVPQFVEELAAILQEMQP